MKKIIEKCVRNKKRILAAVVVLAVLGIAGKFSYSYMYPEFPRHGTAEEQSAHIERILARDSLKAEVRLCEQVSGRIKDPEVTTMFLDRIKLEALHVLAEEARDSGFSQDWFSFFWGSLMYESKGGRPLSARLIREVETGDVQTLEKVGTIIVAAMYNGGWKYWAVVNEGSVAASIVEKDLAAWESLLNAYLAKAGSTPGARSAADDLLVLLAERNDDWEYDEFNGTPTHISVNRHLLDGPVGEAMIDLLGQWNDPARGAAAIRLMSALMRQSPRTDGWWAAQNSPRLGEALKRELAASSEQAPPAQMGKILTEQLLARQSPSVLGGVAGPAAERLEQILLAGEIPINERTLRAVSMQGKRTPDRKLLDLLDGSATDRTSKLDLLAVVPGWAPELVAAAKAEGGLQGVKYLHNLIGRLGRRGAQQELRDECIRYFGELILGDTTKDKELRVEAAESIAYAFRYEPPSAHQELRQKIEALALPTVKGSRISIPKSAPTELRKEIVTNMDRISPESSLYEVCLAHYDQLPMEYKWGAAYSAARAVNAPKATEFFVRAFKDESLEVKDPREFPGYISPPQHTLHWNLMLRLKLPMTEELIEAVNNTSLVMEHEKQSFLRNKKAQ